MRSNWMMGAAGAALALVVVALLGASTALSKPRHAGCHGHGKGGHVDRLEAKLAELELDAETLARIRTAADASRPEHERLADRLHALRLELRERLGEDAPDREAVMQLADRIGAAETALDKHRLATLLEIRALLTPAQRQELVRIFDERRRERREAARGGEASPAP